jgi:hypothetical protein
VAWPVVARRSRATECSGSDCCNLERPPPGTSRDFARGSKIWAIPKARTWRSSFAGQTMIWIAYRNSPPIWSTVGALPRGPGSQRPWRMASRRPYEGRRRRLW